MLAKIIVDILIIAIVGIGTFIGVKRGFFMTVTKPVKWFAAIGTKFNFIPKLELAATVFAFILQCSHLQTINKCPKLSLLRQWGHCRKSAGHSLKALWKHSGYPG